MDTKYKMSGGCVKVTKTEKRAVATAILLVCVLCVVLAACGAQTAENNEKISVVATNFPPFDFTRAIVGDAADVTMLLKPGAETHSFEPTPQDILKIQNCDVFIYIGGESDRWVEKILAGIDTSKMRIITLMDCVEVVEEEIIEGMDAEPEEPEYDEHIWTSPRNAKLIVRKISDVLCEVVPDNAEIYQQNTAEYIGQLDELDAQFRAVVATAKRNTIVFGDRFPFRYFADEYGLDYFAAFPGCATETEASLATVKFLIDKVNDEQIPVVFHIEMSNDKIANTIADATGAKVRLLHSCHNISQSDFSAGKTYISLMTANVDALREALN